ncbi:LysR family transcriptional regulator [Pelagibacterium halotolerans]|uniref:Transcriptional regulatory protein n=1 Tax=Pelagibacterium halotolerans (strain DSM 22347 / JCM 15775 / CGMCC 1.7692 / B2) TaxID=1082931 RepID=G4REN8_PELHB|nr:LysR family transcriptional regulator [Pelagibacterium halotolerans]AEQ50888.1 transcriptional regulatory protein [Pelagibacterium halotolerans B2]QJR19206.1 LysR family transcriptional regulator [Pelagibacterium halotolerans]SDZ99054.1 DNA-binding transcriptional regulator, LysR family [Pelagibacterium halotolerans]
MRHLQNFRLIEAVVRAGSMRRAAEDMNITASALTRRINAFEQEFGAELFERLPGGVRLNPAGELLLHHYRLMLSDLLRVQGQVADLAGERRGHVSIACSQAMLPYFLPAQIATYRASHPGVTFNVNVRDRAQAEQELASYSSDLALVFEPVYLVDFEVIHVVPQTVQVIMRADHPLANKSEVRLRECLDVPHVAPTTKYGVRHLMDFAARRGVRRVDPVLETESFELIRHYVLHENVIGFQIPIGLRDTGDDPLVYRPISEKDMPAGNLILGQMRGRTLPVASARFAMQLSQALKDYGGV